MKKNYSAKLIFFSLLFCGGKIFSQNIAVNTTGTAAAAANLFEVTQPAGAADNSVSIFASHAGTATNAYAIWAEATGATNKYAIVVPSTGGNVGIGTTTPLYKLQIDNTGDVPFLLLNTTSGANKRVRLQFGQGGTINWEVATDAAMNNTDNLYFYNRLTATFGPVILNNGNVGIGGITVPTMKLHVVGATTTANDAVIFANSTGASGQVYGVLGQVVSNAGNASGIKGYASGATTNSNGVWGDNASTTSNAAGVSGTASGATAAGVTFGVYGSTVSTATAASGVYGVATGASGQVYGVNGVASSPAGSIGVYGKNTYAGGAGVTEYGVYGAKSGNATTGDGYGVYGVSTGTGLNNIAGYFSASGATNNYGIIVPSGGGRVGIGISAPLWPVHVTSSDASRTIYVENTSTSGKAIRGFNTAAAGGASGMGGSFESAQTGFSPCCIAAAALAGWGMNTNGGGLISSNVPGLFLQAPSSTGAGITNIGVRYGIYSFQDDFDALGTVTSGTGYSIGTTYTSILANHYTPGGAGTGGQYRFGVHGASSSGGETRVGGVLGSRPAGGAWCSLGYFASSATSYACYGTTAAYQTGAGRMMKDSILAQAGVGSGFYGGVLGGWTRGNVYGMNVKGERYGMYVDGKTYTNDVIAQISSGSGTANRTVTYVPTSTSVDVYAKGTTKLSNGRAFVRFDMNYSRTISSEAPIIVTITPMGKSNGVYIESVSAEGFTVVENNEGTSNVQLSWIAIGTKKGFENPVNPEELLSPDYDANMNDVLFNENNLKGAGKSIWWDGKTLRFDALPEFLKEKPEPEYANPKLVPKDYDHDYAAMLKAQWQKPGK